MQQPPRRYSIMEDMAVTQIPMLSRALLSGTNPEARDPRGLASEIHAVAKQSSERPRFRTRSG
jgi:hypothetical protein